MAGRLPAAPPVLSGFQYVRPLGTGGFADVFLFEQNMPKRPVAVKVLLTNIVDAQLLRMFSAEADAMARLSAHPSILTIYEASISADGRPYLVMEYCPSSFTTRYRRETIPVHEVLTLGVKMGSALETAHRAGMLHRDIKPSNILVTNYGTPVLSDFGIVTGILNGQGEDVVAMSVPWSAPEIVSETSTGTVASEVWSLAATLHSLLAGQSPFEQPGRGMNQREPLKKRIMRSPVPKTGREDVPERLEAALQRAMAKDPRDRFQTVLELVEELQKTQQELGLSVTPSEIADEMWRPEHRAFEDEELASAEDQPPRTDELRLRQRSVVTTTSERVPKAIRNTGGEARPDEFGIPGSEPGPVGITRAKLAALLIGTAVAAGTVVALLLRIWGAN